MDVWNKRPLKMREIKGQTTLSKMWSESILAMFKGEVQKMAGSQEMYKWHDIEYKLNVHVRYS